MSFGRPSRVNYHWAMLLRGTVGAAFAAWCLSAPAFAGPPEPSARLSKARALFDELKFAEAAKAADAAWNADGNDRATVLELLKLQGVTFAIMGQTDKARAAFRALLVLDPEAKLAGDEMGPKVMNPFFEAKGRVTTEGSLRFEAAAPTLAGERVARLNVAVSADPLQMARKVRFSMRAAPGAWTTAEVQVKQGAASVEALAGVAEWWAELLGEHGRVLALVGAADKPLAVAAPARPTEPVAVVPAAPAEAVAPVATAEAPRSGPRLASYGLWGGSVAAAAGGLYFGVASSGARAQLDQAARDSQGRVTGLTRVRALELDTQVRNQATVANVLFGTAAALAGVGVALYLLPSDVAVAATPQGVFIAGVMP
jgi:hypothetical protein